MFQREEGTFLNSFYETTNTLRAKLYRGSTKKESYRPMSFMNIAVKLLIKILANVIQQYKKTVIHRDQVGTIPWLQGWFDI